MCLGAEGQQKRQTEEDSCRGFHHCQSRLCNKRASRGNGYLSIYRRCCISCDPLFLLFSLSSLCFWGRFSSFLLSFPSLFLFAIETRVRNLLTAFRAPA